VTHPDEASSHRTRALTLSPEQPQEEMPLMSPVTDPGAPGMAGSAMSV
jgi:hypothetical protein